MLHNFFVYFPCLIIWVFRVIQQQLWFIILLPLLYHFKQKLWNSKVMPFQRWFENENLKYCASRISSYSNKLCYRTSCYSQKTPGDQGSNQRCGVRLHRSGLLATKKGATQNATYSGRKFNFFTQAMSSHLRQT